MRGSIGALTVPSPDSSVWFYFATDTRIESFSSDARRLSLRHPNAQSMWRRLREARFLPELVFIGTVLCVIFVTEHTLQRLFRSASRLHLAAGVTAILVGMIYIRPAAIPARVSPGIHWLHSKEGFIRRIPVPRADSMAGCKVPGVARVRTMGRPHHHRVAYAAAGTIPDSAGTFQTTP